jgi:hypothetical protein
MRESHLNFYVLKYLKWNLGGNKSDLNDIQLIYVKPKFDNFLIDKTKCFYRHKLSLIGRDAT